MTRLQRIRRGRLCAEVVMTLEEPTLAHMGPRERARLIALATYDNGPIERRGIVAVARESGLPIRLVVSTWADLGEMEAELRRIAA